MEAEIIFMLARWLTCGIWIGAGLYKIFHYQQTIDEMRHNGIPAAQYLLIPVLIMELGGSLLILTNNYVWAVSMIWIAFILISTPFYHFKFYTPDGQFVFPQLVQTTKNLSIIGGLLCLMLLDPDKPASFVPGVNSLLLR